MRVTVFDWIPGVLLTSEREKPSAARRPDNGALAHAYKQRGAPRRIRSRHSVSAHPTSSAFGVIYNAAGHVTYIPRKIKFHLSCRGIFGKHAMFSQLTCTRDHRAIEAMLILSVVSLLLFQVNM